MDECIHVIKREGRTIVYNRLTEKIEGLEGSGPKSEGGDAAENTITGCSVEAYFCIKAL